MKNLFFILTLTIFCSFIIPSKNFELPTTWTNDFSINIYQGGGMINQSTKVIFRLDSLIYTEMKHSKKNVKRHKLTNDEKQEILAKVKQLNAEIISSAATNLKHDKETTEICFNLSSNSHCFSSGATEEVIEKYSKNFGDMYKYLLDFAKNKTK